MKPARPPMIDAANGPALLELQRVSLRRPCGALALDAISIRVEPRQFCALLGPSGAGKTTLLRTILGLGDGQRSGAFAFAGETVDGSALAVLRRRIGMVHQGDALVARLSALDNVLAAGAPDLPIWRVALGLHPASMQHRAFRLLSRLGLTETQAHTPVRLLSGGEQQRVGVARALFNEPLLVLADEPVAQLDPASAERVLSLLKTTTQSEGAATLCSLHQVELARAFADRVIGLRDGCVVFDGPPWDLTARALAEIYGRGDDRAVTTPWPKPLTPA